MRLLFGVIKAADCLVVSACRPYPGCVQVPDCMYVLLAVSLPASDVKVFVFTVSSCIATARAHPGVIRLPPSRHWQST